MKYFELSAHDSVENGRSTSSTEYEAARICSELFRVRDVKAEIEWYTWIV